MTVLKKLPILLFAPVVLCSCGSTGGVMKLGPDTYTVSATKHNFAGGAPSAQSNALELANNFCTNLGKEVLVKNTQNSFDRPMYTYTVTFQCLNKNDSSLTRPNYQPAPNVVIENRK